MAKKAKVTITGASAVQRQILDFLKKQSAGDPILNELGKTTSDGIRNRTRAMQEEYKQPDLKPSTVKRRTALISYGNAFNMKIVSPKRSNLSLSGQLLDAIKYRIIRSRNLVEIFIERPRLPYAGKRKPQLDNSKDNVQIKDELEKKGREFFFVSERLQSQLESKIAQSLRKQLSFFKRLRKNLK